MSSAKFMYVQEWCTYLISENVLRLHTIAQEAEPCACNCTSLSNSAA